MIENPATCLWNISGYMMISKVITVAMMIMLSNIGEVDAGASHGFRGDLVESRYKIMHTIKVKSAVS